MFTSTGISLIQPSAYWRLHIHDYLKTTDKALYLDVDTIALNILKPLHNKPAGFSQDEIDSFAKKFEGGKKRNSCLIYKQLDKNKL